jgi:predicted metal-dependent peptidase
MEGYYPLLPPSKKDGNGGDGDDPGRCGGIVPPGDGSEADRRLAEAEGKMRVASARELARQAKGTAPGWLDGLVSNILEPKVNWKQILRRFLTERAKSDYSWAPPNRRFLSQGYYLPGCTSDAVGHIVIAVDASGSCWDQSILNRFAGEVNGILASYEVKLTVLYHDTRVVDSFEWAPGKGALKLEPKGGGGTSHHCVTEWLKDKHIEPACLVCLTDCYTDYPSSPHYPVLWCVVNNANPSPPFGTVLQVEL